MICDMCGKDTNLFIAKIEGTQLNVCKSCSKFGKIIKPVIEQKAEKKKKPIEEAELEEEKQPEIVQRIVDNFSSIIKNKREKLGLKQEDFAKKLAIKESLLHNIETGKVKPNFNLARKLEKILKIKLIEEFEDNILLDTKNKSKGETYTIGDAITIKKKKKILP